MQSNAIKAAHPQRPERPFVLQAPELALDRTALAVGSPEALGLARDQGVQAVSLHPG